MAFDRVSTALVGGDALLLATSAAKESDVGALHLGRLTATGALAPWTPIGVSATSSGLFARGADALLRFSEVHEGGQLASRCGVVSAGGAVTLDDRPLLDGDGGERALVIGDDVYLYPNLTKLRGPQPR